MSSKSSMSWRSLAMAAIVAGAALASTTSAMAAGDCPADKIVADGKGQAMGPTEPKGVTDTVLAAIDLAKEKVQLTDHQFRMRRLEIQPGGVVPWHSHADRPALIYVVSGEITEYASTCAIPLVHKAGEVSVDAGRSHWWKNTGKTPVVLISSDILHDSHDANM
jgi:quercetin dioxygenase-like cupin family protein